jgi:deoxyguanosine kinase
MGPFFLAIEGAIGVGKTTLARLLQPRFETDLLLEAFEENPFLSDFYANRDRYAFQAQMFFLLSRYHQQQSVMAHRPLIADYTFDKDNIFAHLNLKGDELNVYRQLYDVLSERIPVPDLVVYLRADTDVLMLRIATRDRTYERNIDRDYIERLRQAYERYFATYTQTPVLTVDTNDLNYVHDPSALAFVEGQVRRALGVGTYQKTLPHVKSSASPVEVPGEAVRTTPTTSEWDMVETFLAANEAMGQVGAALAGNTTEEPSRHRAQELGEALRETMKRLQHIANAVGVDL